MHILNAVIHVLDILNPVLMSDSDTTEIRWETSHDNLEDKKKRHINSAQDDPGQEEHRDHILHDQGMVKVSQNGRKSCAGMSTNCVGFASLKESKRDRDIDCSQRKLDELQTRVKTLTKENEEVVKYSQEMKEMLVKKDVVLQREQQDRIRLLRAYDETCRHAKDFRKRYDRQLEEITVLKTNLYRVEEQYKTTHGLLQEKIAELKGAETFINQADSMSGADIITLVNSLNNEILQGAAFMADSLEFCQDPPSSNEVISRATKRAGMILGGEFIQALNFQRCRDKTKFDPMLVQIALQICMTSFCVNIVHSWAPHFEVNEGLRELYIRIHSSGKYRSVKSWFLGLTFEQNPKQLPEDGAPSRALKFN